MCFPDQAHCDACARPRFKVVNGNARQAGRAMGFLLIAHLFCALSRLLSFSFSGALTDIYVVTYGYYITRRFFRAPNAEPVNSICITCESQQNVVCFLMLIALNFGLSVWTLLELLLNKPTIPMPVGLPQFDYRTLQIWQWYAGVATAITVLVILAAEVVAGWYLHSHLEKEDNDLRYDKMIAREMGLEEGNGLLPGPRLGPGDSAAGGSIYGAGTSSPGGVSAPRPRDVDRGSAAPVVSVTGGSVENVDNATKLTEEERLRRRENMAKAAENRVAKTSR